MLSRWKQRSTLRATPKESRSFRMPLRWALTIPFVLLIVGATSLVGSLSYWSGQAAVESLGQHLIKQTNEQVTQELKSYVQMPLLVNRLNVDRVNQGYLDVQDVPILEKALFDRLQQFEQISAVLFVSSEGRFRFVERLPRYYLGVADPPQTDSLQIYSLNGQGQRGALVHEMKNFDIRRDRPFYQRAISTGEIGWSPITRYGNSNALTLDASQPVYDQVTQQLLGVFAVHLRLEHLSRFLRQLSIAQAGQILITDQNGSLIATSTEEEPYTFGDKIKQPNQFYQFKLDQSQNELTRSLGNYLRTHSNALTTNQNLSLEFRHRNKAHYIQITPFQDQYGLNWRVISVIPKSYFLAAIQNNTRTTIVLCLLTLITAIVLGLLAGRLLTQRFAQLSRVSRSLTMGDLDQRLPLNSWIEELNDLSQTYNQMADQLQNSFQQSEARLSIAQRVAQIGIWEWDLETQKRTWSDITYEQWGRDRALGSPTYEEVLQMTHPDDRAIVKSNNEVAIEHGIPYSLTLRVVHPNGSIRYLDSRVEPLFDPQDRVIKLLGTSIDITELKCIETALRESEERFRRAFDDAPIGISLVSPNGQFLRINRTYCDLVGYTEEELFELTFRDLTHPADVDADWQGFQQMVNGELSAFQMQKRYITRHNETVPVLLYAAPIRDEAGKVLYVVAHIQDIRDRLKVEQMKDEFISIVSHELRTPLTSIRGALGILGSGVFQNRPNQAEQMLKIALNNSDRLVRLVNDILTLERLQSGKVPLVMEQCEVSDLIQQAIDSVQALADQFHITIAVTSLSMKLTAAPDAIVQTLTNLLSNAIKFSEANSTVWLSVEQSGTDFLQFRVQDQGRGIPEDKLEMIFEQFQQVDVSDSRQKGGTGLGLAICKKIVQEHRGRIWVESRLGEGSTFNFILPLAQKGNS